MLIEVEYFHVIILALSAPTTGAPSSTCEDIATTDSGNVIYAQANYAIKHAPGTTALMLCKFGYINSFPFLAFCKEDGKWNNKLGECILTSKACVAQHSQYNISYVPVFVEVYQLPGTSNKYPTGTLAMLQCSVGQIPVGQLSAMCLNGKWTGQLGMCKELFNDNNCSDAMTTTVKPTDLITSHSNAQSGTTDDDEGAKLIVGNATSSEMVTDISHEELSSHPSVKLEITTSSPAGNVTDEADEARISSLLSLLAND
ncbi:unnamed protein product [Litomosoides sigmodontis]|uniref:Sushi domain-containing protein n=1 Tax=Litomosoides sigmodontis TaxID=42156 RepID=A0A3P6USW5_LITSI|nr:unnamed protein product [Litomosoides sigmodontis]